MTDLLFDKKLLIEEFDDDLEVLQDLVKDFISKRLLLSTNIRNAISSNDRNELKINVHTLKGSVAIFCADQIVERLQSLEYKSEMADQNELIQEFEVIDSITHLLGEQLKSLNSL